MPRTAQFALRLRFRSWPKLPRPRRAWRCAFDWLSPKDSLLSEWGRHSAGSAGDLVCAPKGLITSGGRTQLPDQPTWVILACLAGAYNSSTAIADISDLQSLKYDLQFN